MSDLKMSHYKGLRMLVERGSNARMTDLAKAMGVTTAAATGAADKFVALGYAKRLTSPSDRRTVWLEITDEGREAVKAYEKQAYAVYRAAQMRRK